MQNVLSASDQTTYFGWNRNYCMIQPGRFQGLNQVLCLLPLPVALYLHMIPLLSFHIYIYIYISEPFRHLIVSYKINEHGASRKN